MSDVPVEDRKGIRFLLQGWLKVSVQVWSVEMDTDRSTGTGRHRHRTGTGTGTGPGTGTAHRGTPPRRRSSLDI